MAYSSNQTPSSSSSPFDSQWSWDVFLSFRGEDTRENFTDHLYTTLIRNNINAFRDNEGLPRGGEITSELLRAIEESRIALVVFSKTYAHSKWCLEELAKIIDCRKEREQKVVPIFYHVDPSEVRNQKGIFEEAFAHHEENADEEKMEKIRRWKTAMREVGNLAGYHVEASSESNVIDDIIEKVHGIIPKVLYVNDNIVGMDAHLERLISLLKIQFNDVRMMGIYGLGGIGKTTIITALYNKISNQFRSISFLTNVREESIRDSGILKLQQQLLDDTLGVKGQLTLRNIHEGVKLIKDKLSSKRVLVFVDDIDDSRQLDYLVGKHSWFGHGSRIIITTRKKYLLTAHGVDYMYEVDKLNYDEALQLFCSYAFKHHLPRQGYMDLSHRVVRYSDCLPLALKVLGSLLSQKGPKDWIRELKKLEEVPNMDITNVLKISYDDGLDDMQKRIFLDIACFFRGIKVEVVTTILDGSGFHAESGINALIDRCFITISMYGTVEMHDLLTQMGKEIVYKECPNEPGERSRLWRYMDVCRVLTKYTGTKKIEGIVLNDECMPEPIKFTTEAFKMMTGLRVLLVHYKRVQLPEDFAFPFDDLTCLKWDGYSLASLPSNFHANNLVHLCLRDSNIKQLWEGNLCLRKLKHVTLDGSKQLIKIPEFSTMPNLECLFLSGCVNLESLPHDIYKLKHLLLLHCDGCSKLTSFPKIKRNIGKLAVLRLDETAIRELPSSIELLKGLCGLYLNNCKNLESLTNNICNLSSLRTLSLDGCSKLGKLPEDLERMPCLETLSLTSISCQLPSLSGLSLLRRLYLDQCSITQGIIKSDNRLNALEELSLKNCNLTEGVFNEIIHLCSLKLLDLSGCNTEEGGIFLSDILVGINQLSNLRVLGLSHCKKLPQIPELPSSLRLLDAHNSIGTSLPPMHSLVNCLKSANQELEYKRSSEKELLSDSMAQSLGIRIVIQGSNGIPEWISNQNEGSRIYIKLPKAWYENNDFLGVAMCCVYLPLESGSAHESETESDSESSAYETDENEFGETSLNEPEDVVEFESSTSIELACRLFFDDGYGSPIFRQDLEFGSICESYHNGGVASEQMWMTLYPKVAIMDIYSYCSNQFMSLEAYFSAPHKNWKVLKCGFQPIYAYDPTRDVDISCCFDCERNIENRKLCLKGQPINQLPWEIAAVDTLCLRDCKNLESLPTSIWESKSLKSLFCTNSSQLRHFPLVLTNMEYLRELHMDGTAIEVLPSSIEHLNRLEILNLRYCRQLVILPESICNLCFLQHLNVNYCSNLRKLPQNLGRLKSLKSLHAEGLNSVCYQSLSLSGLCSLRSLYLSESKLMPHGVIMSDICCLYSLQILDLSFCKIDEGGMPTEVWRLASLVELYLSANRFRSIPTLINQLSKLRVLNLSHCLGLKQIAELPSSLRLLDVHGCRLLETSSPLLSSSIFRCFESVIEDFEHLIVGYRHSASFNVVISRSLGIPKWVRARKKGSEVVAKLSQDWYRDSDLLGFILYATYDLVLDNESDAGWMMDDTYLKCDLTLLGHESQLVADLPLKFPYCRSEVMWMFYYPTVDIKNKYCSNKWKQLKASFCGSSHGKAMKVEECGIHLIYASHAHEHNSASAGKSLIPTFCQACHQDEQSGSQLKLCANEDASVECSSQPDSFCEPGCKSLGSLPSELKSLSSLLSLGCSGLRSFPETLKDVKNLDQLHLDGTATEELPASIQHLQGLRFLNLEDCINLVSLPESICDLKSLTILSCFGCSSLRKFPEIRDNMEHLIQLDLGGSAIEELPSSIENLRGLQLLNLRHCNNLRSLPSTLSELKSLTTLFCSGCSQLRSFPEILADMGNLKRLYLDETAIEELPESIQHLQGLQVLDLTCCNSLVRLPETIGYLKSLITLSCFSCSNLRVFPEIWGGMENLIRLDLSRTSIKVLPSSIERLLGLRHLYLNHCSNLVKIPESICKLSSLERLYVNFCTNLEKFPNNLGSLHCLEVLRVSGLNLSMDCFSSIAADIIQHCKLRILNLSHCPQLVQVPDLPPTLRVLDFHNCRCLETLSSSFSHLLGFSLLKCFKSAIEELECGSYWNKTIRVLTPGNNGIPEWIRQREKGSQITVELPPDWDKNNDFLGFAVYSVCIPSSPGPLKLNCKLDFCADGESGCWDVDNVEFSFCELCGGSIQMCVAYYPKLAIEKHYWSNKWSRLKASFEGPESSSIEVRECGIHLIYKQDIPEDTGTHADAHRGWDSCGGIMEHNDQLLMTEYNDEQRSCDTGSAADDAIASAQTSYHHTQFTEHSNDPLMDATTQIVSNNVVDAEYEEDNRVHNLLELLCSFVHWICCRRG